MTEQHPADRFVVPDEPIEKTAWGDLFAIVDTKRGERVGFDRYVPALQRASDLNRAS